MSTGGVDQLSEKMNKLDTLSGGVVFGKEEAWEKLQARIEAKPKKIALGFRLAAAAALLLVIIIAGLYNYTSDEANVVSAAPVAEPIQRSNDSSRELPQQIAVTAAPHQENKIIIVNKKTKVYETIVPVIQPQEPIAIVKSPVAPTENIPAPATPVVKEMKVVHINDLANTAKGNTAAIVLNSIQVDINRLPVTHINDVVWEVEYVNEVRRGAKIVFRQNNFLRQTYGSGSAGLTDDPQPVFLKHIFNTPNQ